MPEYTYNQPLIDRIAARSRRLSDAFEETGKATPAITEAALELKVDIEEFYKRMTDA